MNLDEKRKVIETLLCAATPWQMGALTCATCLGFVDEVGVAAVHARQDVRHEKGYRSMNYSEVVTEAAYRLIETSPALRREWFGL